jgi:hypothetical protein
MTKVPLVIASLFFPFSCFCQTLTSKACYQETIDDNVKVFTRTLYYPHYKGKEQALNFFLLTQVDLQAIAKSLPDTVNGFSDSVKVKFVITREAQMGNLSVIGNNLVVAAEIKKALIRSSCNWIPGGTEMYLPVWYNGTIHFTWEKSGKSSSVAVSVVSKSP